MTAILRRVVLRLVGVLGVGALVAIPVRNLEAAGVPVGGTTIFGGLAFAGLAVAALYALRRRVEARATGVGRRLIAIRSGRFFAVLIAASCLVRFLWLVAYPSLPTSDSAIYLDLADGLMRGEGFEYDGYRAYWAPGYPLFLVAVFQLFGASIVRVQIANLFLSAIAILGSHRLGRRLGGEGVGRMAAILVAFWPNLVTSSGLLAKELVLVAALPWIVVAVLRSDEVRGFARHGLLALAGVLTGYLTLVQPSVQLLPIVLGAMIWLVGVRFRDALLRGVVIGLCTAAAVAPWTIRNYRVFDRLVVVNSVGGDNFYRANNALAHGGFLMAGEVDLSELPELEADRRGWELGKRWIREHPGDFAKLCVRKQMLFLGDDSTGIYESMRRGATVTYGAKHYLVWKALLNGFWVAIWLAIVFRYLVAWRASVAGSPAAVAAALPVFYLFAMHTVFESAAKYHMPVLPLLAVLAAMIVRPGEEDATASPAS